MTPAATRPTPDLPGDAGHIFISYKAEDRARVKPLAGGLVAEDLAVWWDVHIEGGAAWRR